MKDNISNDSLIKKFLIINFGLTFLFGICLYFVKSKGGELETFAALQMYFPALAAILTLMTSQVDLSLTTKRTYIIYILATIAMAINAISSVFTGDIIYLYIVIVASSAIFLIALMTEKKEKRVVANLRRATVKKGLPVILLFLLLYFFIFS